MRDEQGNFDLKRISDFGSTCLDIDGLDTIIRPWKSKSKTKSQFQRSDIIRALSTSVNRSKFTPVVFSQYLALSVDAIVLVVVPDRKFEGVKQFRTLPIRMELLRRLNLESHLLEVFLLYFHSCEIDLWDEMNKRWVYQEESAFCTDYNHFNVLCPKYDETRLRILESVRAVFGMYCQR